MFGFYNQMNRMDEAKRTDVINPENWELFKNKARRKGWEIVKHDPLPNGKIKVIYKEKL